MARACSKRFLLIALLLRPIAARSAATALSASAAAHLLAVEHLARSLRLHGGAVEPLGDDARPSELPFQLRGAAAVPPGAGEHRPESGPKPPFPRRSRPMLLASAEREELNIYPVPYLRRPGGFQLFRMAELRRAHPVCAGKVPGRC